MANVGLGARPTNCYQSAFYCRLSRAGVGEYHNLGKGTKYLIYLAITSTSNKNYFAI